MPHLLLLVAISQFIVPDNVKDGEFHPDRNCFQYELHDSRAVYKGPVSSNYSLESQSQYWQNVDCLYLYPVWELCFTALEDVYKLRIKYIIQSEFISSTFKIHINKPYHNTFRSFHDKLGSWEGALHVANQLQAGWLKNRS